MEIRIATINDANSIAKLAIEFRNHLQRDVPTDFEFLSSIEHLLASSDSEFFLGESDGSSVGYVLQRYRHSMWANGSEATIEDLFVDPTQRKSGFGRMLIEFAVERAKSKSCTTMCLDTNENNIASQLIYKSIGFNSFSKRWNGNQIFYRLGLQ